MSLLIITFLEENEETCIMYKHNNTISHYCSIVYKKKVLNSNKIFSIIINDIEIIVFLVYTSIPVEPKTVQNILIF